MNFSQLVKSQTWDEVEISLIKIYPTTKPDIEVYKSIFTKLQKLKPLKTKTQIVVELHPKSENFPDDYVEVSGFERIDLEDHKFLIEFVPWREWLGMKIHKRSTDAFSELEIITHCLCEMTYAGFNEGDIQNEALLFNRAVDEYERLTDNGRKEIGKSFDDLLDELRSEFAVEENSK